MYPTDHRGRPTGSNHRPTPRLAKRMAYEMGRTANYSDEGISHGKMFGFGTIPEEAREETAQNMINMHRASTALGIKGSAYQRAIETAVKKRHQQSW